MLVWTTVRVWPRIRIKRRGPVPKSAEPTDAMVEPVGSSFAEQLAAWERVKQRAARGSRESVLAVLNKVPDVEPEEYDRI